MTAKEYLSQLERLDAMINQKLQELDDLREKSTAIGSFDYSKDRVQTSPSPDAPYARTMNRIMDLDVEINDKVDRFVVLKDRIIDQIHALKDIRYVEILYKRYVQYKSLDDIATEMGYAYSYVRKLHGRALQDFERRNTMIHSDVVSCKPKN